VNRVEHKANGWKQKTLYVVAAVMVLLVWIGVPEFNKRRADRLVDELCAKDGGVRVIETVALAPGLFNAYGQPEIGFVNAESPRSTPSPSGLGFVLDTQDIVGSHNSTEVRALAVWRARVQLARVNDGKILGESVQYLRRGGDALGPWHPSSYGCPIDATEMNLAARVVQQQSGN